MPTPRALPVLRTLAPSRARSYPTHHLHHPLQLQLRLQQLHGLHRYGNCTRARYSATPTAPRLMKRTFSAFQSQSQSLPPPHPSLPLRPALPPTEDPENDRERRRKIQRRERDPDRHRSRSWERGTRAQRLRSVTPPPQPPPPSSATRSLSLRERLNVNLEGSEPKDLITAASAFVRYIPAELVPVPLPPSPQSLPVDEHNPIIIDPPSPPPKIAAPLPSTSPPPSSHPRTHLLSPQPHLTPSPSRDLSPSPPLSNNTPKPSLLSRLAIMPGPPPTRPSFASRSRRGGGATPSRTNSNARPTTTTTSNTPSSPAPSSPPTIPPTLHTLPHILSTYNPSSSIQLKQQWSENPKSPIANYMARFLNQEPVYEIGQVVVRGKRYFRATLVADKEHEIIGIGDGLTKKEAEHIAALSALYQLASSGLLPEFAKKGKAGSRPAAIAPSPLKGANAASLGQTRGISTSAHAQASSASAAAAATITSSAPTPTTHPHGAPPNKLSDGTTVDFTRARQFMDYYCARFRFGLPVITVDPARPPSPRTRGGKRVKGSKEVWEAVMTVGGRRIGMATGRNKKEARERCYVDVAVYLEECDPELWKAFVEKHPGSHEPVGMAPVVMFRMAETLDDDVRAVCREVRESDLYGNSPRMDMGAEDGKEGKEEKEKPLPVSMREEKSLKGGWEAEGDEEMDANAWMVEKKETRSPPRPKAPALPTGPRAMVGGPVTTTTKSKDVGAWDAPSERFHTAKSQRLKDALETYNTSEKYAALRAQRHALPVYTRAEDVLAQVRRNAVTIVMAATGSGKTTQLPQLILDDYIMRGEGSRCNIICTQPRRIAAISVAERVATERGERVGQTIGYQVRFESKRAMPHGAIDFCTTGVFLKRMQGALSEGSTTRAQLDAVTHVIVDEVHERDIDIDLVLVVLKRLLADREKRGLPLKVVLMSATIDPALFTRYFADEKGRPAPVAEVPGRAFPVEKRFLDEILPDLGMSSLPESEGGWVFKEKIVKEYILREKGGMAPIRISMQGQGRFKDRDREREREEKAAAEGAIVSQDEDLDIPYPLIALVVAHVIKNSDDGHVLVFLPGWDEISNVRKYLTGDPRFPLLGVDFLDPRKFLVHVLHSSVPVVEQQAVFDPAPKGVRRIILATNIAETSVTIPDVVYVVDSARVKEKRYDPNRYMSSLISAWVGKSNLNQRAGRAGRHRAGFYYGVLSRSRAESLRTNQLVEMQRVDLSDVVMRVKALNFPGMDAENILAACIEPPHQSRVAAAIEHLRNLGALDVSKDLTSLGRLLIHIPTEARLGKLCLFGSFFRCLDPALTIVAIMCERDPFMSPPGAKQAADEVHQSWSPTTYKSDVLAVVAAYNEWWRMQSRGEFVLANRFCTDNFLSKITLLAIQRLKAHLLQSLEMAGVLTVAAAGEKYAPLKSRDPEVPKELNTNSQSLPLLAAMIAIASQPNFAINTGERTLRTSHDRIVFIHPSSVNSQVTRNKKLAVPESLYVPPTEKGLYAFGEKSRNTTLSEADAKGVQTFLRQTTRLDPLTYMLFGAYHLQVTERGLECDEWLPIGGDLDALDDVERLKVLMNSCMLRVFEGINKSVATGANRRAAIPTMPRAERDENEDVPDDDDEDNSKGGPLSAKEMGELGRLTKAIVSILDRYSDDTLPESAWPSRPQTPYGQAPGQSSVRLNVPNGSGSGWNTPGSSRPMTPANRRW